MRTYQYRDEDAHIQSHQLVIIIIIIITHHDHLTSQKTRIFRNQTIKQSQLTHPSHFWNAIKRQQNTTNVKCSYKRNNVHDNISENVLKLLATFSCSPYDIMSSYKQRRDNDCKSGNYQWHVNMSKLRRCLIGDGDHLRPQTLPHSTAQHSTSLAVAAVKSRLKSSRHDYGHVNIASTRNYLSQL